MDQKEELKNEMAGLQVELQEGLDTMLAEIGKKLSANEIEAIKKEVEGISELLERLKTGLIWIALFGKVNVGKSALANALIGEDKAKVYIGYDATGKVEYYEQGPWKIGDIPGVMSDPENQIIAKEEALKAHGHIFVLDGEPLGPELEIFDFVHKHSPNSPRIIFVNKIDEFQNRPKADFEIVKKRVFEKMRKYVKFDEDIVFGSAEIYDRNSDKMVRQRIPQLEARLLADTTTFGSIVNVYFPAEKASELSKDINGKIIEVRKKVARNIIKGFAIMEVGSTVVPFGALLVTPGLLGRLTYVLIKTMGEQHNEKFITSKVAKDILKVCGEFLFADFIGLAVLDTIVDFFSLGMGGALLDLAGVSYFKYRRTLIFGEVVLSYIENDFSFGKDPRALILNAKESAKKHYEFFKNN